MERSQLLLDLLGPGWVSGDDTSSDLRVYVGEPAVGDWDVVLQSEELGTSFGARLLAVGAQLAAARRGVADTRAVTASAAHDLAGSARRAQQFVAGVLRRHSDALGPEATDRVQRADANLARLRSQIEGLMALLRLDAGPSSPQPLDFGALIGGVAARFEERARVELDLVDAAQVQGERSQLECLVKELLDNSVVYQDDPLAEISIRLRALEGGGVRLEVEDRGIGIDDRMLEAVFEPFRRLHAPQRYKGIGLGLTRCRRIAERHGGSIWAEPCEEGARIVVELP